MDHIVEIPSILTGLSEVKTNLLKGTSRQPCEEFYTSLVRIAFGPKTLRWEQFEQPTYKMLDKVFEKFPLTSFVFTSERTVDIDSVSTMWSPKKKNALGPGPRAFFIFIFYFLAGALFFGKQKNFSLLRDPQECRYDLQPTSGYVLLMHPLLEAKSFDTRHVRADFYLHFQKTISMRTTRCW